MIVSNYNEGTKDGKTANMHQKHQQTILEEKNVQQHKKKTKPTNKQTNKRTKKK